MQPTSQGESSGIDIHRAHTRARILVPEAFFWDCTDELSPFGSDEGDMALAEYRDWRRKNPHAPTLECLKWVVESLGEMRFSDYNSSLLNRSRIKNQIDDKHFDDQYYIYTLDISIIATGFGQLVDEGQIDPANKPTIQTAIERQLLWAGLQPDWQFAGEYISKLHVLSRILAIA